MSGPDKKTQIQKIQHQKRAANKRWKEEVVLGERREEWMGEPKGSFVPRSTIIIVTFDQGGTLVSFMDHRFFPSSHPTEDSAG